MQQYTMRSAPKWKGSRCVVLNIPFKICLDGRQKPATGKFFMYKQGPPKAPLAAQNFMRHENLPGTKIKKLEGQNFSWYLCLQCYKTHVQTSLIATFSLGRYPRTLLRKGKEGGWEKGRSVASWLLGDGRPCIQIGIYHYRAKRRTCQAWCVYRPR